jgi:hypothetical protein
MEAVKMLKAKLWTGLLLSLIPFSLQAQDARITAMNPRGTPPPIRLIQLAPRPDSLDGKTLYFVDVRYVGGDTYLKEMMSWFSRNMPKVKLVFRQKAGAYAENDPKLWDEIKANGDAMIMAIGH